MRALDNICARPPAPWAVWIHWIHTAGRASGSTTMVVMFVVCLYCVLQSLLVIEPIVCKKVPEHNLKVPILPYYKVAGVTFRPTHACTIPKWHPSSCTVSITHAPTVAAEIFFLHPQLLLHPILHEHPLSILTGLTMILLLTPNHPISHQDPAMLPATVFVHPCQKINIILSLVAPPL